MPATWIVAANASRARFFSQPASTDTWEEIHDMVNEAIRLRVTENTESDKRGPTAGAKSTHNVGAPTPNKAFEPSQPPDVHQAELFARDIVAYLEQAQQQGRFEKLELVVSPQFLGMLRKLLGARLESLVDLELNKDYTQFSPQQLREQLRTYRSTH